MKTATRFGDAVEAQRQQRFSPELELAAQLTSLSR